VDYVAARTLDDAYRALEVDDAHCLAGGQSLVAMMNLGLVIPQRLVSLRSIASLKGITSRDDGGLRIGAMTTHAELAALEPKTAGPSLIARTARVVAYPAIRQWGTIGGSIAHADPAADYPVALLACGARIEIGSARGARQIAAAEFFRDLFETALEPGEIVTAIEVPPGGKDAGSAYQKLSMVTGDFAIVSVAAMVSRSAIQVAVGGYGATAMLLPSITGGDERVWTAAAAQFAARHAPPSDHRASGAYRARVVPELIVRAVRAAQAERPR
jgi:aerobic carbon-monoxide dehydrogenase medium subunit